MRRPSIVVLAAVPICLAVMTNLATDTVAISGGWWPPVAWATTGSLAVAAILLEIRRNARERPSGSGVNLAEAADEIAGAVDRQWRDVQERRLVDDPVALPVRWRCADRDLVDHWTNIRRAPAGQPAEPLPVNGRWEEVAEVYRQVPSGRLVILGTAGSGKTVLAAHLLRQLLSARQPGERVPVILSAGSWRPPPALMTPPELPSRDDAGQPVGDWAVTQLVRDYPGLASPVGDGGRCLAQALIDNDMILLILDGFDEIPPAGQPAALQALNETQSPVVLTSRVGDYARAVASAGVLSCAAGIVIEPLSVHDLADYLPRTTTRRATNAEEPVNVWDPVLTAMREEHSTAASVLLPVLTNPLMVYLARVVYSHAGQRDPAELLDHTVYSTAATIERHLLAAYLPAVYHRSDAGGARWSRKRREQWLTRLAGHLHRMGVPDLAWWKLRYLARPTEAAVANTIVIGAVLGLAIGAATAVDSGLGDGLYAVPFHLLVLGPAVGLPLGFCANARPGKRRRRSRPGYALRCLSYGVVGGWLGSGLAAAGDTIVNAPWYLPELTVANVVREGARAGIADGTLIGFLSGLVASLAGPRQRPARTRWQLRGRLRSISGAALSGCALGVCASLAFGAIYGVLTALDEGTDAALLAWRGQTLGFALWAAPLGLAWRLVMALRVPTVIGDATNPTASLKLDRTTTLALASITGVGIGVLAGVVGTNVVGPAFGLTLALTIGLVAAAIFTAYASAWGQWLVLVRFWLPLTGRLPWRLAAFLTDAHRRGVLRQNGATYQFRHLRLQEHLLNGPTAGAQADHH